MFENFYARSDTFSLGVCNGCQLFALLGVVGNSNEKFGDIDWAQQPRFVHNESGRFESRFGTVRIESDSKAMMFKGMEGSVLGVWVAHGEGRAHFPDDAVMARLSQGGLAPLRYVDDSGNTATTYPMNLTVPPTVSLVSALMMAGTSPSCPTLSACSGVAMAVCARSVG